MYSKRLAFLFLIVFATPLFAADPDCSAPEYRQLDFWIGEWDVSYQDGKKAGKSVIQKVLQGCVLLENWSGEDSFEGKSFNFYDRSKKKWIQKWVDSRGQLLEFEGEFRDGTLEYVSKYKTSDGKQVLASMAFMPVQGTVRQVWKQSVDEGKTWKTEFDGIYTKTDQQNQKLQ